MLDLSGVIYMDTTGADALLALLHTCEKRRIPAFAHWLAGQAADMAQRKSLLDQPGAQWLPDRASAIAAARAACP